jgi:ribose transport system substrate-binding protein
MKGWYKFMSKKVTLLLFILSIFFTSTLFGSQNKKIAYLVSDIRIPFWSIMSKGIVEKATQEGYSVDILSANNIKKNELKNITTVIKKKYDGIIISPINSSTAGTIINLANKAHIPVTVSDIGADFGEYVAYISSDNLTGAYHIGKVLTQKMQEKGYGKSGTVGIVAIPQKRANGQARTQGFMRALDEAGIKAAGLLQQVDFSYKETYNHSKTLIQNNPNLKAIWLQGSDRYQGALDAIKDSGNEGKILLVCFDAEPEFLQMIPNGQLVGAAMQQPFLMGYKAAHALLQHLQGISVVKEQKLDILAISQKNINQKLPIIKKNVLGLDGD